MAKDGQIPSNKFHLFCQSIVIVIESSQAMGLMSWISKEWTPVAAMVALEFLLVGFSTLNKEALLTGMSPFILVFYSNAFATLIIAPFAYFFERNKRPSLSLSLLCKFFFMSLIGITLVQNGVAVAIDYSSPTLASAMKNLIPAFTFILAVFFRMEKLNWRSTTTQTKMIGTVLSVSGALIIVLYKGPSIVSSSGNKILTPMPSLQLQSPTLILSDYLAKKESNWTISCLLFAFSWFSIALWTTLQGPVSREYPSKLSLVSFYTLFASIQSGVFCFVLKRNQPNAWSLIHGMKIKLIAIIYGAVFGCVGQFCVEVWCIRRKGPVYASMFKPLGVAIAALTSFVFFGEKLHLGMVIGTAITVTGFYGVLWAKSKENKEQEDSQLNSVCSFSHNKQPLLQNDNFSQGQN